MPNSFEEYNYNNEFTELKNIAIALYGIAKELRGLGFGDAVDVHPGGLESVSMSITDGLNSISASISDLSLSIKSHR